MFYGDREANNVADVCNLFADYFRTTYRESDSQKNVSFPSDFPTGDIVLSDITIDSDTVFSK